MCWAVVIFFLMIRRPPRSTLSSSSAASDVYKRQVPTGGAGNHQHLTTFDGCMDVLDTTGEGSSSNPAPPIARTLSQLDLPHQRSTRIVAAIREMFGGNSRGVLCCAVRRLEVGGDEEDIQRQINSTDDLLSYAHHFKSTANEAVPYDLPPELQRLTEAMSAQQSNSHSHSHHSNGVRDHVLHNSTTTTARNGGNSTTALNTSSLVGGRRSSRNVDVDVPATTNNTTRSVPQTSATERVYKPPQQHRNGLTMSRTSSMASNDGYTPIAAPQQHQRAPPQHSAQHHQAPPAAPPQHVPLPATTATTTRRFVAGMPLSSVVVPSSSTTTAGGVAQGGGQRQQYPTHHNGTRPPSGTTSHNTSQYHDDEARHHQQQLPRSSSSHNRDDDAYHQQHQQQHHSSYHHQAPQHQPPPSSLDRSYHDHFDPRSALGEDSDNVRPRFAKSNQGGGINNNNTHSSQLMGRGYPIKGDAQYRI
eukprot:TRINITY_DN12951_c0_g1_i2.p1 TRINITY_DN12951_c0_g1~~TRINITY_DN12951_c0_g1_i2.p1  ORF type:complete len:473 (-),score=115.34 TRINITY_DN12951_c0_g1_i2:194-1612(-)